MAVSDDLDRTPLADVEAMLRRTLDHHAAHIDASPSPLVARPARAPWTRRRWTAVAACVVAALGGAGLVAVRLTRDASTSPPVDPAAAAVPAGATASPSTTVAPTTTRPPTTSAVPAVDDGGPTPDPDGPHTAYATVSVTGGMSTVSAESLTLVGDDVDTSFNVSAGSGQPQPSVHNRRVDGVLYVFTPQSDGTFAWTYDPDDTTTLSLHPTGETPFVLYDQVAGSAGFEHVDDTVIDDIPVRHISATTPDAVDSELLRLAANTGVVESLDLWVTEDNVVLRIEATLAGDPPVEVTVEFTDVGSQDIELAAPGGATELDGQG